MLDKRVAQDAMAYNADLDARAHDSDLVGMVGGAHQQEWSGHEQRQTSLEPPSCWIPPPSLQ
eukprot:8614895-Prorocentrum_lima.AAC.1